MTYVLLQLGVNLFVKATIILGGAGLIVRCMRRSSAATRHLV